MGIKGNSKNSVLNAFRVLYFGWFWVVVDGYGWLWVVMSGRESGYG